MLVRSVNIYQIYTHTFRYFTYSGIFLFIMQYVNTKIIHKTCTSKDYSTVYNNVLSYFQALKNFQQMVHCCYTFQQMVVSLHQSIQKTVCKFSLYIIYLFIYLFSYLLYLFQLLILLHLNILLLILVFADTFFADTFKL